MKGGRLMLKAAIVGCGKIADAHASAIAMLQTAELVGACDNEELMAKQLVERYKAGRYFNDIRKMLSSLRPDVIHVTTPPQSHFQIATTCLEEGCHVYLEKPFTINSYEAEKLIRLAEQRSLKLTVGTDEQFSHIAIRMRELIQDGYLGGPPVHMDVYYCYDLGDERYARNFLENKDHWLRKLPGQLMHNVISHGIAKVAEHMSGDNAKVMAYGFTSGFLRHLGEQDLIDELRVIIDDNKGTTSYFTFSTQMRPLMREFRIFGPKNGLILNQDHHSLVKVPGINYKSYLDKIIPLRKLAKQYNENAYRNARLFLKRDFHMKAGMNKLIELFYRSIANDSPPPISYREILFTAKAMDSIFSQLSGKD